MYLESVLGYRSQWQHAEIVSSTTFYHFWKRMRENWSPCCCREYQQLWELKELLEPFSESTNITQGEKVSECWTLQPTTSARGCKVTFSRRRREVITQSLDRQTDQTILLMPLHRRLPSQSASLIRPSLHLPAIPINLLPDQRVDQDQMIYWCQTPNHQRTTPLDRHLMLHRCQTRNHQRQRTWCRWWRPQSRLQS